jgi:hypothetical protein
MFCIFLGIFVIGLKSYRSFKAMADWKLIIRPLG